eukprot:TRINITY_DN2492_c0_g1_i2.p1 TRINITY_DN2492_c0_g1~~TRINITY_DN2492_c0_g1_i2.p1  ORF type:complete len:211 (+),score=43.80 TRINITY_DN2492_c0_g1_i2:30-662(+)
MAERGHVAEDEFIEVRLPTTMPGVTPFVSGLAAMVADPANKEYIFWQDHGESIVIKACLDFETKILPKYFKTSKFCSFVRQLNIYGFHKINENNEEDTITDQFRILEFSHPNFRRGRQDLLATIKRRKSVKRDGGVDQDKGTKSPVTPATPKSNGYDIHHHQSPTLTPTRDVDTTFIKPQVQPQHHHVSPNPHPRAQPHLHPHPHPDKRC